jgi:hypothetical protein
VDGVAVDASLHRNRGHVRRLAADVQYHWHSIAVSDASRDARVDLIQSHTASGQARKFRGYSDSPDRESDLRYRARYSRWQRASRRCKCNLP